MNCDRHLLTLALYSGCQALREMPMKTGLIAALALTAISLDCASAQSRPPNHIAGRQIAPEGVAQEGAAQELAPPCTGRNPHVAVPSAPHGMFVWLYSLDAQRA